MTSLYIEFSIYLRCLAYLLVKRYNHRNLIILVLILLLIIQLNSGYIVKTDKHKNLQFISDFGGKVTHYFDTLFTKTTKILLFSIKFPKSQTNRKHNLQICSILPSAQ